MALILVLIILVLGYRYCSAIPVQQAILKRSSGWESYVLLGQHGINIILQGFLVFLLVIVIGYAAGLFLAMPKLVFELNYDPIRWFTKFIWFKQISGIHIWVIGSIICSFLVCQNKIEQDKKRQEAMGDWTKSLRKLDAILDIIIFASSEVKPVKVSLKSRKVYVGLIISEQFEQADSDNIAIIPYLSGHRDKDTLVASFDHNYLDVYKKNNLINSEASSKVLSEKNMAEFKCVIRLNEVESISLFDLEYYPSFLTENKQVFS